MQKTRQTTKISQVRLARTQTHLKADVNAVALDQVRAMCASLSRADVQRLMLGLLGYLV